MPNSAAPAACSPPASNAVAATLRPAHRQLHRARDLVARAVSARAFVERHDDVRAEQPLDLHRALGGEHVLAAVDVAAKLHAFLGQLAQLGKAHHLIAAAVGQDRARPVHELVQAAEPRDALGAGAQHEVIGIAEDDVGAGRAHGFRFHRLDRRRGADRHEGGRADLAAAHGDPAGPRQPVGRIDSEGKARHRGPR